MRKTPAQNKAHPPARPGVARRKAGSTTRRKHDVARKAGRRGSGRRLAGPPRIGLFTLHAFARLPSTSDHAKLMLARGELEPPSIVLATRQTAGRGRGDNTWWSGPGCLTTTFVMKVDPARPIEQVPLYAGVALRRAMVQLAGDDRVQLKWPNDLIFDGRKLAGILCERERGADLIGIGLNIAPARVPARLRPHLAALRELSPRRWATKTVLDAVAMNLWEHLARPAHRPFAHVRREYDLHHQLLGRRVLILRSTDQPVLMGRCQGLDDAGRLLVHDGKRLHAFVSGTVRLTETRSWPREDGKLSEQAASQPAEPVIRINRR